MNYLEGCWLLLRKEKLKTLFILIKYQCFLKKKTKSKKIVVSPKYSIINKDSFVLMSDYPMKNVKMAVFDFDRQENFTVN